MVGTDDSVVSGGEGGASVVVVCASVVVVGACVVVARVVAGRVGFGHPLKVPQVNPHLRDLVEIKVISGFAPSTVKDNEKFLDAKLELLPLLPIVATYTLPHTFLSLSLLIPVVFF